ncbi:hypothetical protein Tco_0154223 [Tanacetum coccineum]
MARSGKDIKMEKPLSFTLYTVISSDSASSEVTYTSISSYGDLLGWAMDFFRLQEAEAAPASPEYEVPIEDQPYAVADSPIALSLGYIADSDPEEDSEDGPVDYPADGGDNDDDDSSDDEEEEEASEEEEAKEISIRPEAPILLSPKEEVKKLLALTIPPTITSHLIFRPSIEDTLLDFRAAMGRLRASSLLPLLVTAALPLPSPPLPPLPSSPLPPLPDSLFIPPVDHREDIPKAELPPRKRLCLTTPTSRYEVGESSTVILRPTGGHLRETTEEVAPVTLKGVNTRVTELTVVQEQDTQEIYVVIEDTQVRQTQIYQTVKTLVDDSHLAVNYELQGYRTHVWTQDHRMDVQDSLIAALTVQVSSLQGHLATALGEIRALQTREQAHADVPEGTDSSS